MISQLRSTDFSPLVGKVCHLVIESGVTIPVTVEEVTENLRGLPPRARPGRRIPFSVILTGPPDPALVDSLCTLHAPNLDRVEGVRVNRIMPLDGESDRAWYQIVFN